MPETDFIKLNKLTTPFILGVAGGSGSGKTYFSKALVRKLNEHFNENICELICQDNFYIDQSQRFDYDGGSVNFDHPESIDFQLLADSLKKIKSGEKTSIPTYDFAKHSRVSHDLMVHPNKIIIVDGILIFHAENVRSQFDDLIFFETSEELRYQRRLDRDVKERGRTPEGVKQQFESQVKPMHDLYVEPSKVFAKTIVNESHQFDDIFKHYINLLSLKQGI